MTTKDGLRLFVLPGNDTTWIAEFDDALWRFPGENGGWSERRLYDGPRELLREVGHFNAAGTGWPGSHIPSDSGTGSA